MLDKFLGFVWAECIYVIGAGLLIASLMAGALFGDLGVAQLFQPSLSVPVLTSCGEGRARACLMLLGENPLRSPSFQAGALHLIFTGLVLLFWLRRQGVQRAVNSETDTPALGARHNIGILALAGLVPLFPLFTWAATSEDIGNDATRNWMVVVHFTCGACFGLVIMAVWLKSASRYGSRSRASGGSWLGEQASTIWIASALLLSLSAFVVQAATTADAVLLLMSVLTASYVLIRHAAAVGVGKIRPTMIAAAMLVLIIVFAAISRVHAWLPLHADAPRPYRIAGLDRALVERVAPPPGIAKGCVDWGAAWQRQHASQLRKAQAAEASLIKPRHVLDVAFDKQERPRVVIIAASGGAYRATFWTAAVIDALLAESGQIGNLAGFADSIVLLTGASGGAVALAYFAATYNRDWRGKSDALSHTIVNDIRSVGQPGDDAMGRVDSLRPVANHLVSRDLLDVVLKRRCGEDRGQVLERQWPALNLTFAELAERATASKQQRGSAPHIILQPVIVQTGEPLYITNLDLPSRVTKRIALLEQLPAARSGLTLASAARLSATFPLITPTVDVPLPALHTADRKHHRIASGLEIGNGTFPDGFIDGQLVDAGYFDNQGVDAAAAFLMHDDVLKWIGERAARIFVVEIRAQSTVEATATSDGLLQFIGHPVSAFLSTATRGGIVRADTTWSLVHQKLASQSKGTATFERFVFTNQLQKSVPMTWFISEDARNALRAQMQEITNVNVMAELRKAWNR